MIRDVKLEDASKLIEIVNYYIENTAINFSYDLMTVQEMESIIKEKEGIYPFLVIEENDEILGYAYVSPFVGKQAYQFAVETTIYLRHDMTSIGYGKKLYLKLEEVCKKMGIQQFNACIGYTQHVDKHLNNNSSEFHEHMGYKFIGKFERCGYKFHTWYDMVWYSKQLQTNNHPKNILKYKEIK